MSRILKFSVVVAVVVIGWSAGPQEVRAFDALHAPVLEDCTLYCVDGPNHGCSTGQHYAYVNSFISDATGTPHTGSCLAGSCADVHGQGNCKVIIGGEPFVDRVALEDLRVMVLAGDAGRLARFVSTHPNQVSINRRRSAVQVIDCVGRVKAHLPLSAELVSNLAAAATATPND